MIEFENLKDKIEYYGILNYHVLEGMADWVRVVDKDGTVIYANKAMKEAVGNELIGTNCFFGHRNTHPCNMDITRRAISQGEIIQKKERINGRDYSIKSSPVFDEEGKIFAAVEVFRDVTRERRLELELLEKNGKMNRDLDFAKKIQEQILPLKGSFSSFKFDYMYIPSEMLSGDFFDIFFTEEKKLGFYIADVVGHGVTASIMTMFVRQTIRFLTESFQEPGEILKELHKRFNSLGIEADKYFTILYASLDLKSLQLTFSNGGHNGKPLIRRGNEIIELYMSGRPISNLFTPSLFKEKSFKLEKGDKLLLYTDGIVEARNLAGEYFGLDRLKSAIMKDGDSLEEIKRAIDDFSHEEQEDDLAAILIELKK